MKPFTEKEFGMLLNGISKIDIEDWKNHTDFVGNADRVALVQPWFWDAVESFTEENRTGLLQFTSGQWLTPCLDSCALCVVWCYIY